MLKPFSFLLLLILISFGPDDKNAELQQKGDDLEYERNTTFI